MLDVEGVDRPLRGRKTTSTRSRREKAERKLTSGWVSGSRMVETLTGFVRW